MRTFFAIAATIVAGPLAVAACGGDDGGGDTSGVDGNKTIITMSAGEKETFCSWAIEKQGGPGSTTQCEGFTITTQTVAECVTDFGSFSTGCTATVAQAEACVNALATDACTGGGQACAAIFACLPE